MPYVKADLPFDSYAFSQNKNGENFVTELILVMFGWEKVCQEKNTTMIILKKGHTKAWWYLRNDFAFWLPKNLYINESTDLHSISVAFHSKHLTRPWTATF